MSYVGVTLLFDGVSVSFYDLTVMSFDDGIGPFDGGIMLSSVRSRIGYELAVLGSKVCLLLKEDV